VIIFPSSFHATPALSLASREEPSVLKLGACLTACVLFFSLPPRQRGLLSPAFLSSFLQLWTRASLCLYSGKEGPSLSPICPCPTADLLHFSDVCSFEFPEFPPVLFLSSPPLVWEEWTCRCLPHITHRLTDFPRRDCFALAPRHPTFLSPLDDVPDRAYHVPRSVILKVLRYEGTSIPP